MTDTDGCSKFNLPIIFDPQRSHASINVCLIMVRTEDIATIAALPILKQFFIDSGHTCISAIGDCVDPIDKCFNVGTGLSGAVVQCLDLGIPPRAFDTSVRRSKELVLSERNFAENEHEQQRNERGRESDSDMIYRLIGLC